VMLRAAHRGKAGAMTSGGRAGNPRTPIRPRCASASARARRGEKGVRFPTAGAMSADHGDVNEDLGVIESAPPRLLEVVE
jgi:hypothetical protein